MMANATGGVAGTALLGAARRCSALLGVARTLPGNQSQRSRLHPEPTSPRL